jgi:hypothetical protein
MRDNLPRYPARFWDKFKALLKREEAEFASLTVAASPLLGSGMAGEG